MGVPACLPTGPAVIDLVSAAGIYRADPSADEDGPAAGWWKASWNALQGWEMGVLEGDKIKAQKTVGAQRSRSIYGPRFSFEYGNKIIYSKVVLTHVRGLLSMAKVY